MEVQYILKAIASLAIVAAAVVAMTAPSLCEARPATSTEFIRTSCSATTYPTLCYSSLSSHAAAIQQNPKLLASAALSVSLDAAVSTSAALVKLSKSAGLTPREAAAMRDCVEEMSDSVDQLRKTMAELNHLKKGSDDSDKVMSDAMTWVSAALTYQDTCMDGFAGNYMNGAVKTAVRAQILNLSHITSNALSLINTYASSLHA